MKIIRSFITLSLLISTQVLLYGSDITIKGKIIDGLSERSLPYANISLEDGTLGTACDEDGRFIFVISQKSTNLMVSYIGYKTEIFSVKDYDSENELTISLFPKDIILQEVAVYNKSMQRTEKLEASNLALQTDKIAKISNAMPDVLRSVQALPGISANNEFSAEFNVRGGNKDENLIQVNGAQVYEPYHLKEAQNASVGVFNVELIDKVSITTGGFGARYGDRLSSVANINYREGSRDSYRGAATLSMAFVDGYLEGPLLNNGSFIVAARKTYMEYLIDITDFGYSEVRKAEPTFYDIQGMITYDLSKKNKLNLTFIHAADNWIYNPDPVKTSSQYKKDYFSQNASINTSVLSSNDQVGDYYSSLLDLRSINILSSEALLKFNISYYDQRENEQFVTKNIFEEHIETDDNYYNTSSTVHLYGSNIKIKTLEFGSAFDYQLTPYYDVKAGLTYKNVFYDQSSMMDRIVSNESYTPEFPDTFSTEYVRDLNHLTDLRDARSYKSSAYWENVFQIKDNLLMNIAGRMDYFNINKDLTFSPRINFAYTTGFGTIIRAAWGHFYQSPIYTQLRYSSASDENTKSQMAIHYVLGAEQNFDLAKTKLSTLKLKLDLFYKDYKNLISSYYSHYDKLFYSKKNDAVGYAKGLDTYILLNLPYFYTTLSYSYLIAMEDELNDNKSPYPRLSGQTHTLSWITDVNLGKGWGLNTKFYYGSGYPFAEKTLYYYEETNEHIWETESTTTSYLPSYQRFDIRVSKDINVSTFKIKTFLEISNTFNHKNIRGYEYTYDAKGNPIVNEIILWPMLPSFGIKIEF